MTTFLAHSFIPLAFSSFFSEKKKRILITGILLSILPDIDVIGFFLGIPYDHMFGHRGITHSFFFAFCSSILATRFLVSQKHPFFMRLWGYFFLCSVSHFLLDALTNGGLGVAFFAPFSGDRFFFPVQPIQVSPLLPNDFLHSAVHVLGNELLWIGLPCLVFATCFRIYNRFWGVMQSTREEPLEKMAPPKEEI